MAGGALYCTVADAREHGAQGDDAAIEDAILTAGDLIDRYTGRVWAPVEAVVVARVAPDGTAYLPWQVESVTEVRVLGAPTPLALSAFAVTSSKVYGGVDAVRLGGASWADPLVVGAEPWAGGWSNLLRDAERVQVTGTFGPDHTPRVVRDACAALAAWLTTGGSLVPPSPSTPGGNPVDTDDEGNVLSITVDATQGIPRTPTTGLEAVDAALVGHVSARVVFN
jgi:hypothetical protein